MKSFKKIAATVLLSVFGCMVMLTTVKPIEASASIHFDWWNTYEDDCGVSYQRVQYGCYKVVVVSSDCHRVWTNDTNSVAFWYPTEKLEQMIGHKPNVYNGSCVADINVDLLNDTTYFARFIM